MNQTTTGVLVFEDYVGLRRKGSDPSLRLKLVNPVLHSDSQSLSRVLS